MALLAPLREATNNMTREQKRFWLTLVGIALFGLAVRITFALVAQHPLNPIGDAARYHGTANLLADGEGYVTPFFKDSSGAYNETAINPPLYTLWIALPSLFGFDSTLSHQIWSSLLGTGTIVLIGLIGRRVAGERCGLIAAVVAAIYPNIFFWDTAILAETMSIFTVTLAMLLSYRYWEEPSTKRLLLVGAAGALAALSRAELTLLVLLLVIGLVLRTPDLVRKERFQRIALGGLAALLVVAPWIAFNLTRFEKPVLLTNGLADSLASTQCDKVYYGKLAGYWDLGCTAMYAEKIPKNKDYDESERSEVLVDGASEYLKDHLDRFPVVVMMRLGRALTVFRPTQSVKLDQFPEGRDRTIAESSLWSFRLIFVFAIAGAVWLWRRKKFVYPLLAVVAMGFITVMVSFATPRYRSTADPALVVLAAVAVEALIRRWRDAPSQDEEPEAASTASPAGQ